ncbi:LuxR C-terminal-related transcriptional regulator [Agromyces endophyticus]|uniref:helix-turn-helix transcriptional regulator n=1 Tax=Agromyces sp. H17E-10 TaxID=2932244 RepID=UPI001FD4C0A6|nr:LuxR C-terminal-related transcriptional regulator [Agromyces sp. H17E-10]UOQ91106.1 LuxR C-terminal-related transcriptional regulator [Agromyces sp. H17E-10]
MWEGRAARARGDIAELATSGLGVAEMHRAVLDVVARSVPFEQACWSAVDPDTLMMTSITNWPPWPVPLEFSVAFAESELTGAEPNSFANLATRDAPTARLSDAPHRDVVRSVRLNDLLRPQGLEHELRAAFTVDGATWAVGGVFREPGADFSDREVEFLGSIVTAVAAATRVTMRSGGRAGVRAAGPVIILCGPDGEFHAATAAGAEWLAALDDAEPGRFDLVLHAVAAGARRSRAGTVRLRMRDVNDDWVVVQASRLISDDDPQRIVITVDPAALHDLVDLLLSAYGVSPRERDVCLDLVSGSSTAQIAAHLHLSPHTVHDHMKSIYGKVGVGSRSELVARLLP